MMTIKHVGELLLMLAAGAAALAIVWFLLVLPSYAENLFGANSAMSVGLGPTAPTYIIISCGKGEVSITSLSA